MLAKGYDAVADAAKRAGAACRPVVALYDAESAAICAAGWGDDDGSGADGDYGEAASVARSPACKGWPWVVVCIGMYRCLGGEVALLLRVAGKR